MIAATSMPYGLTSGMANVIQVRKFRSMESFYKFMATGNNSNSWKRNELLDDLPSGQYSTQIGMKDISYTNKKTGKRYTFPR